MRYTLFLALLLLVGCAANPETVQSVAATESARLAKPTRPFSTFAHYELRQMALGPAVEREEGKVEEARDLENRMRAAIDPLLAQWAAAPSADRSGTLVIEPRLAALKVVSGGARFWAGAWAGDSLIDIDLFVTEKESGETIANPRLKMEADAMAGGWSIGATDQNLLDYVASTARQYLVDNY
jgi:hypothetical protein